MASQTTTTSQHIIDHIGGADNVASLTHCATRLRFQLVDQSKVDVPQLESDPAVLGVVKQGTTGLQVIMGGGVAEYYNGIMREPGMAAAGEKKAAAPAKKEYGGIRGRFGWVDYAFEFLSDTFRPVLWALLGASLIITLLVLADTFHIQDFRMDLHEQPPEFQFAHAMWRSVFYFLPIMVGATAARKLGANEWIGAAIPAALFTPEFMGMKDSAREVATAVEGQSTFVVDFFGLPMYIQDYGGQVFPPILAAILLYFLEKGLKKTIPASVHMVFVPFLCLLILIPLTALVVGPFGIYIGNGIAGLLAWLNDLSPFILSVVVPLLYPFLVPLGLHWPLNAIMIVNISTLGYDVIQGPMGAWNFACFGVIFGVFILSLKERNRQMRQVSFGATMAGLLGGISEPSLYGVLLRFRRSYYRLLPGCLIGGVVMGFFSIKANAFVFTSLLTVFAMDPLLGYCLGIAAAFVTSFLLTITLDYRTKEERTEMRAAIAADQAAHAEQEQVHEPAAVASAPAAGAADEAATASAREAGAVTTVDAPMAGTIVALADVPDPAFAAGALGQGVAIEPSGDTVVAPADGKIIAVPKSGHAVGLRLDNGIDMLIHIGIDTVTMNGEGFEVHVANKQRVSAGEKLITFDREKIAQAGFPAITPVLVSNTKKFASVTAVASGEVAAGQPIIEVTAKSTVDA
ncbi:glucose PTS transporter subunit IIA [Corynebacterium uberis]|uniref:glucose PTS transporter subunit IIA n=1 Tax=Corynebacterium uberis TaxID=2883169 RepID=UPI001D0B7735|nr:glucose PTS transporter subunit IIA [Corynebacterium uberis]UDL85610.1 glucose PTS transporter subunit IIA [Corynebacterium uberis]